MTDDRDRGVMVVGVDGSPCSHEALRWAARQAELTGAELHAVMAWSLPEIYGYVPRDFAGETNEALVAAIQQALGKPPRVPVIAHVVEGHARGSPDRRFARCAVAGRG